MVRQVEELLRDLGWAEGFHIPVANDENKIFEAKVEQQIKKKGELTIHLEDITDRLSSLIKLSENIKHELQQNQDIIAAHKRQVETEENMYKTAKAEQDSFEKELKLINKAFHELGERHFNLQNGIIMHTEKLEKLKANVKWDKDALLSWGEEMARGEEDNQLLAKCAIEDESKTKELELSRLRLCKEVDERNELVLKVTYEAETLDNALNKLALLFRKAHDERQEFIMHWEASAQVLRQRDEDIHNILEV
ncbi:hypothetical protein L9F63_023234 [Diploptera punctata]|uniref:Coiled-coil domain-containing protein 39 n=1 Tax=Diploptera punctata TaxID=6984 RepID=A0AAD7ZJQ3_DIPPU|nr:hypothetical protein L9F63_023234 [Diploptera punctata]